MRIACKLEQFRHLPVVVVHDSIFADLELSLRGVRLANLVTNQDDGLAHLDQARLHDQGRGVLAACSSPEDLRLPTCVSTEALGHVCASLEALGFFGASTEALGFFGASAEARKMQEPRSRHQKKPRASVEARRNPRAP